MLTLLALLAAFLGPGLVLADNSGGGPISPAVVSNGSPAAPALPSGTSGVPTDPITVDDNSGGGPIHG
jgi:hypothetical protein